MFIPVKITFHQKDNFTQSHSVDSAASLRSQLHADRIRWPPRLRPQQQRSVSEIELAPGADLEYLDNPAETLECSGRRPPPRPRVGVDDDYYRHLTARNQQERWWLPPGPAPAGPAPPVPAAPALRRSRSLAVIREESCPGPLIPRARLADKPLYKERLTSRSKFQSKEEALERIYNKSNSSCYGDISDNPNHPPDEPNLTAGENLYEDAQIFNVGKKHSNSWIHSVGEQLNFQQSEEITYSHNPSEIDSLDSNYIHKNYNFEANHTSVYRESSPDTTDHDVHSQSSALRSKPLFIRTEKHSTNKGIASDYYLPEYTDGAKYDTDRSSNSSTDGSRANKSQTNFNVLEQFTGEENEPDSFDGTCVIEDDYNFTKKIDSKTITKDFPDKGITKTKHLFNSEEESNQAVERVTTLPDKDNISVTSYITISPPSPDCPTRRLENLAVSLAEKIDEYCDSKYGEHFVEIPLNLQSAGNSFSSKSYDDLNSIYTQVHKIKPKIINSDPKYKSAIVGNQKQYLQDSPSLKGYHDEFQTRSLYRQSSSAKNITTEPFVTTLVENQYFSLPDINVSKSLKRSETIDAKLRLQDENNKCVEVPDNTEKYQNTNTSEDNYYKEINVVEVTNADICADSLNTSREEVESINETEVINHYNTEDIIDKKSEIEENILEVSHDIKDSDIEKECASFVTLHEVAEEVDNDKGHIPNTENIPISTCIASAYENLSVNRLKKLFINDSPTLTSDENDKLKKIISDLPIIPNNYKKPDIEDLKVSITPSDTSHRINDTGILTDEICKPNKINVLIGKRRNAVKNHYSLRQREPKPDFQSADTLAPPSPPNEESPTKEPVSYTSNSNQSPNLETSKISSLSSTIYDVVCREKQQIQRLNSFLSRDLNILNCNAKEGNNVTILPLSGHQTIIIEPPVPSEKIPIEVKAIGESSSIKNLSDLEVFLSEPLKHPREFNHSTDEDRCNTTDKSQKEAEKNILRQIPRVKKERSFKIAEVQNKFERPPPRLIIKDKKLLKDKRPEMSRPQVLTIKDRQSDGKNDIENNKSIQFKKKMLEFEADKNAKRPKIQQDNNRMNGGNQMRCNKFNVTEKVDNAVKTDIEYQEKLHSVKNYWSKLIENKSGDEQEYEDTCENIEDSYQREFLPDDDSKHGATVEDIIKSIETVKIVDSIKKNACDSEKNVWKKEEEAEKEKAESVIEESPIKRIICDSSKFLEKACDSIKETFNLTTSHGQTPEENLTNGKESEQEYKSFSPDIEIVELSSNSNVDRGDVIHTALIKSKSYDQDCGDFDHVRYKVMKSDMFRKSMIGNYNKEAQFDGLLQYLQDYSFQELLVNNNIVIIEPVRTKIENTKGLNTSYKRPNSCRVTGATSKESEDKTIGDDDIKQRKQKQSGLKRHFFYHPIRVNKEIIEEELPNPDTVKTVRNLFEGTLRMHRPGDSSDPCLLSDSTSSASKRSVSHKNLSMDSKLNKSASRNKVTRYLTIDTAYGQKKWDSASLSSGVSSGDLSSNNDHDYDTDALSPFQSNKVNNDNIYSSSSEEYLCESLNPSLCYESQYVSQDILQKIRECGTSITYYGGKVLNEKNGPAVSPMTKAIMDEIRGLQRNCCRDCTVCQTKCTEEKCVCLDNITDTIKSETASVVDADRFSKCCSCSEITEKNVLREKGERNNSGKGENYSGFKFKLVKSNSCSSRLELAGTGEDQSITRIYRSKQNRNYEDPPIIYDNENSVKTKICRIESYRKGMVASPFDDMEKDDNHMKCDVPDTHVYSTSKQKSETPPKTIEDNTDRKKLKNQSRLVDAMTIDKNRISRNRNVDLAYKNDNLKKKSNGSNERISTDTKIDENVVQSEKEAELNVICEQKSVAETIKSFNDPVNYEKKFYYVNADTAKNNDKKNVCKFGEMVFEEFEILDPNANNEYIQNKSEKNTCV